MRSRTSRTATASRPGRGPGRGPLAALLGLALGLASGLAEARQATPSRPAPPLEPPRAAPGLDLGADPDRPPPPGLDPRPAPEAFDPRTSGVRYRFVESYDPQARGPEPIGSYRVAFLESLDQAIEAPGAAPQRTRLDARVICVERPAAVAGLEGRDVKALLRVYQTIDISRDGASDPRPDGPAGLLGQTLWLQDDGAIAPTTLTLVGSPALTQDQFNFAAYQQIYLPKLAGILSPLHVGVGSQWAVSKPAAEALIGDAIQAGVLEATFEEVIPPGPGDGRSRAVFRVAGRVQLVNNATTAVNARLEFAFTPPPERPADEPLRGSGPTMVDVRGAIVRVLLAQRDLLQLPDDAGRIAMRAVQSRELNLERRLDVEPRDVPSIPVPPPDPTDPRRSWVVYRDPDNRFLFRHPQDFRPAPIDPDSGESVALERVRVGGVPDNLTFLFHPRGEVPPELRPEPFVRRLVEGWRSVPPPGVTLGRGSEGYLPEDQWRQMRVYRVELPLSYQPGLGSLTDVGQAYSSAYLIQFANGAALEVMALTEGDPEAFRDEVEAMLKEFRVDPPPSPPLNRPARQPAVPPDEAEAEPAPTPAPEPTTTPTPAPEVAIPPIGGPEAPAPGPESGLPSRPAPPPFE